MLGGGGGPIIKEGPTLREFLGLQMADGGNAPLCYTLAHAIFTLHVSASPTASNYLDVSHPEALPCLHFFRHACAKRRWLLMARHFTRSQVPPDGHGLGNSIERYLPATSAMKPVLT